MFKLFPKMALFAEQGDRRQPSSSDAQLKNTLSSRDAILSRVKILLVHEIDYVNKPFFEFQEFAEGLSNLGHQVTVLHVQEFNGQDAKKHNTIINMSGLQLPSVQIKLYSTSFVVRGLLTRFLAVLEHLRLLIRIFISDTPDVVLSYSVPTSGVTVALLGRVFNVPVVHRAIDVSHLLRSKLLAPLVRLSEIAVFSLSDSVSTHNEALRAYVRETPGLRKEVTIEYPPVYPVEISRKTEDQTATNGLRIVFIGSLAHFTNLEGIMFSLSGKNGKSDIKLRIVGSGPKERKLKRLSHSLGLDETIEFRGWKSREELSDELAWADIGIVAFKQNKLTNCALPHKAIEYLSAGLPVVSTQLEGAASILGGIAGMHFVDSVSDILERCESLANNHQLGNVDSATVNRRFGREPTLREMEQMLRDVHKDRVK